MDKGHAFTTGLNLSVHGLKVKSLQFNTFKKEYKRLLLDSQWIINN